MKSSDQFNVVEREGLSDLYQDGAELAQSFLKRKNEFAAMLGMKTALENKIIGVFRHLAEHAVRRCGQVATVAKSIAS